MKEEIIKVKCFVCGMQFATKIITFGDMYSKRLKEHTEKRLADTLSRHQCILVNQPSLT